MEKDQQISVVRAGSIAMQRRKPPLKVSWHLTRMCNYYCSYCMQKKEKTHPASNSKTLEAAKKLIRLFGEEEVRITLFGGEPLIHPALLDVVRYYRDELNEKCRLMAQTNGSQNISFFRKLFDIDPKFHINQSVHLERVDETLFLEKLELFCADDRKPKINVMLFPPYREKAKRLCEKLLLKRETLEFSFDISLIRSPESNFKELCDDYTDDDFMWRDEIMKSFEKLHSGRKKTIIGDPEFFIDFMTESKKICRLTTRYSEALRHNLLSFKGMTCLLGHRLIVDVRGFLKIPCVGNRGFKTNIYDDEISEIDYLKPVVCPKLACYCKADITSAKYISEDFAPQYIRDVAHSKKTEGTPEPVSIEWILQKLGNTTQPQHRKISEDF